MKKPLLIAPSFLASDFGRIADEAKRTEQAGADWLHVDIMDGHFVPNLTFGPDIVATLRKACSLPLDVHLMIEHPDRYVERFIQAGAFLVTVHVEEKAKHDTAKTLQQIRAGGAKCGLAINPPTPFEEVIPFLGQIDLLLCMTVNPGFGGQSFIPEIMEKVSRARKIRDDGQMPFQIEVDGGINLKTAADASKAGVDVLVAGTSLYRAADLSSEIAQMRRLASIF